jgi:hypothetical protein
MAIHYYWNKIFYFPFPARKKSIHPAQTKAMTTVEMKLFFFANLAMLEFMVSY